MGQESSLLITVVALIFLGGFIAFFLSKKKSIRESAQSKTITGIVERYGYCTKTPNGWGYWLLRLEGEDRPILIWPHQHENHEELALTKTGDRLEVRYHVQGDGAKKQLIANQFKNLSY